MSNNTNTQIQEHIAETIDWIWHDSLRPRVCKIALDRWPEDSSAVKMNPLACLKQAIKDYEQDLFGRAK